MQSGTKSCQHQLKHPPDSVTDSEGFSYRVFECILCGCEISLQLNSEDEVDLETVIPPARKLA
jgi:hypothetical protein